MQVRQDRDETAGSRTGLAGQLSAPLRSFLATESGSAGVLLAAALLGLAWANSPWSDAYESLWATEAAVQVGDAVLAMDLHHWVNDGLMAVFFFVVGLEVRRELSVGELTDRRRVRLPLAAGLAGMAVPALVYLALNPSGEAADGWGIVIGTDTAFMLGALAVLGPTFSTQLRIFLLTLTVIDDIVAVTVIGAVYSDEVSLGWLAVALATLVALAVLDRSRVWRASPYVVLVLVLWLATVNSGLHSSIAGMVGGLLIAAHDPRKDVVEGAAQRMRAFRQSPVPSLGRSAVRGVAQSISVNERLQTVLHSWTSYVVVPLFALANAGVDLRGGVLGDALTSPVTWGVVAGLVLGKPVGITIAVLAGARLGLGRLPQGVETGHVAGGAALSGIGFTVSLLITGLAFDDPALQDQATVAVLLSAVLASGLGWLLFQAGRVLRGEGDADLPRFLDRDVDPGVDHVRGPVDAPLTLVEYADFECPFCAKATDLARELRHRLGDDLRYVFRHLPLTDVHQHAELAARGALAADRQEAFWAMHDLLFAHQDELEVEDLVGYAGQLDLDTEQFVRDLEDDELDARIRADVASAEASGARGTPTFFVNGRRHTGPHDAESLAEALAGR
ncbi:Na+/H+ antiporter NhaA [Nocardioides sp. HDW12B]|uniref:Na+/H+ antiporter NhaA n=1 Tax=Nocardioides sp. HDW12B TaxID=2714939 RepID=UPI001408BCD8|nr:Na+/H+ antiporter NhaA [Nocardioides sp. HDW12B]QIK67349.1 Na+/H+ antiporter NhaA [Nocardioides sp. HDW12B]